MQHDALIAGKMFNPATGRAEAIDYLKQGPDQEIETKLLTDKWSRCAQGVSKSWLDVNQIFGNETIIFMPPHRVPAGRKVTCSTFVCTVRPGKAEPCRIHMMVGGDK